MDISWYYLVGLVFKNTLLDELRISFILSFVFVNSSSELNKSWELQAGPTNVVVVPSYLPSCTVFGRVSIERIASSTVIPFHVVRSTLPVESFVKCKTRNFRIYALGNSVRKNSASFSIFSSSHKQLTAHLRNKKDRICSVFGPEWFNSNYYLTDSASCFGWDWAPTLCNCRLSYLLHFL